MNRLRQAAPLVALVLSGCATGPEPVPEETAEIAAPQGPELVAETVDEIAARELAAKKEVRVTVAAVGDMMLGTDYPDNRLPDDDGVSFLAGVTPALSTADLTIGNLEGVLVAGGEPGKKCSNPSACYRFRSPPRYAHYYKAAGFDVLSLANNHARDFGETGRSQTMVHLTDAGILHTGRVGDFASIEVNGLKVAVLGYAVTRNSNMLLDYAYADEVVADFAESHDLVIVTFHGGAEGRDVTRLPFDDEEYYGEPRGDVVRFARNVVDAGADLVIGHGPHVVRAMERYKGRLIAYSLGNFATYYGISVAGIKGVAPIVVATLDGTGEFLEGEIVSTEQIRPAGPSVDPAARALMLVRDLSLEDFGEPGLEFRDDGRLLAAERPAVERRTFEPGSEGDGGPVPCTEPWFWEVETVVGTDDGMGHGPDIESAEWKSVVQFRLGQRGNPAIPDVNLPVWCRAIEPYVRERVRESRQAP